MAMARADLVSDVLSNYGIVILADGAATRTRAELVTESAGNLGIVQQAFAGGTRTRPELVTETFGNLGFNYQADASATRTRADWTTETLQRLGVVHDLVDESETSTRQDLVVAAMANMGAVFLADASATRTRAEWVTETLHLAGIIQQTDASATRTRADWVNETLHMLGVVQQSDASATKTRADLVNNVAFILGPAAVGQVLSADDYSAIDIRLDTIVGDLNARAIATVANLAAIPGAWFDALSAIVANVCKDKYGVTGDEATKLQVEATLAEAKLKTLTRTGLVDEILPQIIGDLNARGVATVANIAAIPGAWFASLADIAAEYVKGKFDIPAQRSQEIAQRAAAAEQKLRTLSAPALVDELLPSLVGELNARGIATIANIAAIPGAWFPSLSAIAADYVKGKLGVSADRSQELAARALAAERTLKIITRSALIDSKVDAVVGDLLARRITFVGLPVLNVQTQLLAPLAAILADSVKGYFDIPPDLAARLPGDAQKAERDLKVTARSPIVDELLPSLVGELNTRNIATIANIDAIPGAWFASLADIAAEHCKGAFELAPDRSVEIAQRAAAAERKLKAITQAPLIDEKIPSVLGELSARMIVTVADPNAVPTQYFSAIAAILADAVKGKFELPLETMARLTAEAQDAERRLKTLTRLSIVDEKIPSIIGELNARGIVTVANIEAIPGAYFSALADIVAESCRGKFEVAADIAARVSARAAIAERTLKNLTRSFLVDRNLDSILATLAAQNIVYLVDQTDIPDEWYFSLAAIVADRCKGKFELDALTLQRVSADGLQAVMDLRELTRGRPSYLPQQTSHF